MKTKTKFSVSLPTKTLERLKIATERENMSVNGLINRTLENYAIWNTHNTEFIPIRKALLEKFLDKFTHEEIDLVAENMAHTRNKNTVLRVTSQFDALSTIKTFEEWLRMTGFPYSHEVHDSVHRFIVLHDLGNKWSLYLTKLLSSTLNQFGLVPKCEYTDKVFSITIDLGKMEDMKKRTDRRAGILDPVIKNA